MKIATIDNLFERIGFVTKEVKKDKDYGESYQALAQISADRNKLIYSSEDIKMDVAERLKNADRHLPMHPDVAKLVIDILDDCASEGSIRAMNELGDIYSLGRTGKVDDNKAIYYLKMADKSGDVSASVRLGYIYYHNSSGEPDYEKAYNCFVKGALADNIFSLYMLGDFYMKGYYVETDIIKAYEIYEKCLYMLDDEEDILPEGLDVYIRVADCLYHGAGVKRKILNAFEFYTMAEYLVYKTLVTRDIFYKDKLEHILKYEEKIRKELRETVLPI
ncbi:MAG: sel1 repeat family protein, partial [Lachnospiraceae bacterium]|nr:sel1 repeat family protein [Lachnospiraceae bacterium]